jgi:hypothetical protein
LDFIIGFQGWRFYLNSSAIDYAFITVIETDRYFIIYRNKNWTAGNIHYAVTLPDTAVQDVTSLVECIQKEKLQLMKYDFEPNRNDKRHVKLVKGMMLIRR